MRKLTVFCVILMLCLQVFSGTAAYGAVSANNIVIENYISDKSDIYEGDAFELTLMCSNTLATATGAVYANIDSTSSFHGNPSNSFKLYDDIAGNATNMPSIKIKLIYTGTGNELKITLTYSAGGNDYIEEKIIYISKAHPTSTGSSSSTPVDTSKYMPKPGVADDNNIIPIVAGVAKSVNFSIKNSSIYQAKNITMSLKMVDSSKAPLILESLEMKKTIDQINGNEAKDVGFIIKTLRSAPDGLYEMKLKYQFENAYGDRYGDNTEISETVYIRVQNTNTKPTLAVDNIAVKPDASNVSTGAVKLELTIKNIGTLAAKDIKVTLGGLKSGGFTTHNSSNIQYISRIAGNSSGVASYQLLMPSGSMAGGNELTVKMEYKDDAGSEYTMDNQIFVPAGENGDAKPSISFDKIVSPQSALAAGENFEIKLDLKNGGAAARNIKVSLTTGGEIITKSMNPVYIDKLDSKAVQNVVFKLFSADEAVTKNYPVAINIEYEDIFGTKYNASQYVGVFIENSSGKTVPRIIVDKYSIEPSSVRAAEDFKLKLSFLNTSKTVNVSNIKVTVASDDGTFTPTDTGNTFYLEGIPAQESVERELMLHVKPDAEQKSYALTVNFEYEDEKGNPFTTKEIVSVRVLQNPRLVTGELSLPPETYVGQPLSLYIDFYNMGKSTLYNMLVKAVGDFDGQNLSYYVGNFESGRTDSFDVSVIPSKPGKLTGNVIFSFEDANGKVTEIPKEFTVNVMEMQQQGAMLDENGIPIDKAAINGQMPEGMKGKKTSILLYIIPAVFLAALIVFFIVFRKRRARRKEMSLDE